MTAQTYSDALPRRAQAAGLAFFTLFHAYGAAQSLQSSLNKGAGYVCLALLYGFFAVSALAAPRLVGTFGEMKLMWLSAIPYVVMVAGNVPWLRDILLPACAGVGIAAATLWSSQGLYIGSLARRYVELNPGVKLSDANSLMNSKFFTIYSSSSGLSSLLASVVLMITDSTSGLFVYLTIVGAASVYLIASLVPPRVDSSAAFAFVRLGPQPPPPAAATTALPALAIGETAAVGQAEGSSRAAVSAAQVSTVTVVVDDDAISNNVHDAGEEGHDTVLVRSLTVAAGGKGGAGGGEGWDTRSFVPTTEDVAAMQDEKTAADALPGEVTSPQEGGTAPPSPLPLVISKQRANECNTDEGAAVAAVTAPSLPTPASPPPTSITYMVAFLTRDPEVRHLIPLLLVVGLGSGAFNGVWLGALVGGGYGTKWVGFVAAAYSFASSAATWGWGKLVLRPSFGRARVMAWAFALHMAFLLLFAAAAGSLRQRGISSTDGDRLPPGAALPLFFLGSVVYAAGDAVWVSQIPATLQTFYPSNGGPDTACAMATIRFFRSLGISAATGVAAALDGHVAGQLFTVAAAWLVAAFFLRRLHNRVRSLNGGPKCSSEQPSKASEAEEKPGS